MKSYQIKHTEARSLIYYLKNKQTIFCILLNGINYKKLHGVKEIHKQKLNLVAVEDRDI